MRKERPPGGLGRDGVPGGPALLNRTLSPGCSSPPSSQKYAASSPRNEDGDFLKPVFPQISGDAGAVVAMETFPPTSGKEELGSRPCPHHPHTSLAPACRGPQVENNPPPPDFPSRGSASRRGGQLVSSLLLRPRRGITKTQARGKQGCSWGKLRLQSAPVPE